MQACLGAADIGIAQREGAAIHSSLKFKLDCVASSTNRYSCLVYNMISVVLAPFGAHSVSVTCK